MNRSADSLSASLGLSFRNARTGCPRSHQFMVPVRGKRPWRLSMHLPSELVGTDSTPSLTSSRLGRGGHVPTTFRVQCALNKAWRRHINLLAAEVRRLVFFGIEARASLPRLLRLRVQRPIRWAAESSPELSAQEGVWFVVLVDWVLVCRGRVSGRSRWIGLAVCARLSQRLAVRAEGGKDWLHPNAG